MPSDGDKNLSQLDCLVWEQYCQSTELEFKEGTPQKKVPGKTIKTIKAQVKQGCTSTSRLNTEYAKDITQADRSDWNAFIGGNQPVIFKGDTQAPKHRTQRKPNYIEKRPSFPWKRKYPDNHQPSTKSRIDPKILNKLNNGELKPEGEIDLHHRTQAEAEIEVTQFVLRSHREGKRLILIITGRGLHTQGNDCKGILSQYIPILLEREPLVSRILHVQHAHNRHGGKGAYYCYLKRLRNGTKPRIRPSGRF